MCIYSKQTFNIHKPHNIDNTHCTFYSAIGAMTALLLFCESTTTIGAAGVG